MDASSLMLLVLFKMLPLKLFDCFQPAYVIAGLPSRRRCERAAGDLVIIRATVLNVCGGLKKVPAD